MDLTKRDMAVVYGGRTFALRAYRDGNETDGPGWCPVVVEDRTPLRHDPAPTPSLAGCFAEAVRFVTAAVEADASAAAAVPAAEPPGRPAPPLDRAEQSKDGPMTADVSLAVRPVVAGRPSRDPAQELVVP